MEQKLSPVSNETCDKPASLIKQFLVAAAEIHQRELTLHMVEAYKSALLDLPVTELRDALNSAIRNVQYWPTPAHIRQQWESMHAKRDQAAAEQSWDGVLAHIWKWGIEQLPVFQGGELLHAPGFDDVTEFAMRQVGGYRAIGDAPGDQLRFMRRDFVAAYGRYRETGGYRAPSRLEAKQLLEEIGSAAGIDPNRIGTSEDH